jgi:hypothetical protein
MQDDVTLGLLVWDWFNENMPKSYVYYRSSRFDDIHSITCRCHEDQVRSLAVILDEDLIARVFVEKGLPYNQPDWVVIHAGDPDFFTKFKENILLAHNIRYGEDAHPI